MRVERFDGRMNVVDVLLGTIERNILLVRFNQRNGDNGTINSVDTESDTGMCH
jgi:hypothetical protein